MENDISYLFWVMVSMKKIDFCSKLKIKTKLTLSKVSYIQMTHAEPM